MNCEEVPLGSDFPVTDRREDRCPNDSVILQNGDHVTLEAHFSGILDVRSVTKN